jgi:hypothetical protein
MKNLETFLIKDLMDQAGTDTSGKWMSIDHASKFAKLIVEECCKKLNEEVILHDGYGYNQHELYNRLKKHFGVEE